MHMKQPFSTDLSQCATEAKKRKKKTPMKRQKSEIVYLYVCNIIPFQFNNVALRFNHQCHLLFPPLQVSSSAQSGALPFI